MKLPEPAYRQLLTDLQAIRQETEYKAITATRLILIEGYWRMGKRLFEESLIKEVGTFGMKRTLLMKLAEDLGLEYSFLTRVIKFFRLWPETCPAHMFSRVGWSHYKKLLTINDAAERSFYLEHIDKNRWPVRVFRHKVKQDYFRTHYAAGGRSIKAPGDEGAEKKGSAQLKRSDEQLHYYVAALERVVDGDTLILNIDLGFDVWKRQRIRLRGVDTPEAGTPEGKRATAFVQSALRGVMRMVIQTHKIDMYGRYVCDVFYMRGESDSERIFREGTFLNQELLDHNMADEM